MWMISGHTHFPEFYSDVILCLLIFFHKPENDSLIGNIILGWLSWNFHFASDKIDCHAIYPRKLMLMECEKLSY